MVELTEVQVWTMMGVFTTLFFGTLTVVSMLFVRVVRAEIGGLRAEMNGRFEAVDARFEVVNSRFDAVDTRIDAVNGRIDAVNGRIDAIDRDVQVLVKRTFGLDRG